MALTWGPAAAAGAAQIAGAHVPHALAGVTDLIAESARTARTTKDAALALSLRIDEMVDVVRAALDAEPGRRDSWRQGLEDFCATLVRSRELVSEQLSRSYVVRLLHKERDAEQLQFIAVKVKTAYDILMTRNHIDLSQLAASTKYSHSGKTPVRGCGDVNFSRSPQIPPAPLLSFGRVSEMHHVTRTIADTQPAHVAILGGPGMGKTALAVAVLHAPAVEATFQSSRCFVDCSERAGDYVVRVCNSCNITVSGRREAEKRLASALRRGRSLLVLDNFESWWDDPRQRPDAEKLLEFLAAIDGLSLIVTLRGSERPHGIAWTRPLLAPLQPLSIEAARQTFVAISDASDADLSLPKLLGPLDGIPLAVTLMGCLAQVESLDVLLARWNDLRTGMLIRGVGHDRLTSLEISINASLQSPRMQQEAGALELIRLLALLPLGAVRSDIHLWARVPTVSAAVSALLQNALAYRTDDGRVRVLTPIREYLLANHPPSESSVQPLFDHYFGLVNMLLETGKSPPQDVIAAVAPDAGNIDYIIRFAFKHSQNVAPTLKAAVSLCALFCVAGIGSAELLPDALSVARAARLEKPTADLLFRWGWLAFNSIMSGDPRALWEEARVIYDRIGDVGGVIDTTTTLAGFMAAADAVQACKRMRSLAEEHADAARAAMCCQRLAFALERAGRVDAARACHEQAIATLRALGDADGRILGFSIRWLGELDIDAGDVAGGMARLHDALAVLRTARYRTGVGETRLLLGSTLWRQGKAQAAIKHLTLAQLDFQGVASATFELECLRYLVGAYLDADDVDAARDTVAQAEQLLVTACDGDGRAYARCLVLRSKAELALRLGDAAGADAILNAAMTISRQRDVAVSAELMLQLQAEVLELFGQVQRKQECLADAGACLLVAALIYRRLSSQIRSVPALVRLAGVLEEEPSEAVRLAMQLPLLRFGVKRSVSNYGQMQL